MSESLEKMQKNIKNIPFTFPFFCFFKTHAACKVIKIPSALKHAERAFFGIDKDGNRVKENHKLAFQLFLKAAKKELPSDQKSYQEALAVKRAAGFHVACCFEQGLGIKKNSYFAALWFERTAKRGHPAAQFNYACYLHNGMGGMAVDLIEAAKQYELAEKTVVEARYNLALFMNLISFLPV